MPWNEVTRVESRKLFVHACEVAQHGVAGLCREFGISRKTGYKWLGRWHSEGEQGLADRSRRPHRIVRATPVEVDKALVALRQMHPHWGARKLCWLLGRQGMTPPPERTANRILQRHGLVDERGRRQEVLRRFERSHPNALWQIDHKRAIHGSWAARTVPLVVLDDHSRYLVGLRALPDKGLEATWSSLWAIFEELGLPEAILNDNDMVFHGTSGPSQLEVRLMRLGIVPLHGRTYHPQTQGKVERLNGTLERELLRDGHFRSAQELQAGFDRFREEYNYERPHEALGMQVPASRYRPSARRRPKQVPAVEYPLGVTLRAAQKDGFVSWKGWRIEVGTGLCGERVEIRETGNGIDVYYGPYRLLGATLTGHRRTHGEAVLTTCQPERRASPFVPAHPC
jgi:transposase InsO family protein